MDRFLTRKGKGRHIFEHLIMGWCAFLGVPIGYVVLEELFSGGIRDVEGTFFGLLILLWPVIPVTIRRLRRRKARGFARFFADCPDAEIPVASLDRLTRTSGAESEIRELLDRNYLQNVSFLGDHIHIKGRESKKAAPAPRPTPAPAPASKPAPTRDQYEETLRRIRELNAAIADDAVSARIDQIEAILTDIFSLLRSRPAAVPQARTFLNYYLPTTIKLLESYDQLEDQKLQGDTIRRSRARIEEMLEKVVFAFERQRDQLFEEKYRDIETEVRAMEAMMASEGMDDKNRLRPLGR